jgi:lactoylglutathione lyase
MRTQLTRLVAVLLLAPSLIAQTAVRRPRILGISHVAVYVKDLGQARTFYKGLMGFDEPYSLKRPDGSERAAVIKINDQQSIELFAEDPHEDGQFSHLALRTDDAAHMHDYLLARGASVSGPVHRGQSGDLFFTVKDPDGHLVEIVEPGPDGMAARNQGRSMPAGRVATRLSHAGILTGSLGAALKFYRDILGFREFWHGSSADDKLHWDSLRVPDGDDYLELMLYKPPLTPEQRGLQDHIGLETSDLAGCVTGLKSRAAAVRYARPIEIRTGKDRRRETDLWSPDGSRVELREAMPAALPTGPGSTGQ